MAYFTPEIKIKPLACPNCVEHSNKFPQYWTEQSSKNGRLLTKLGELVETLEDGCIVFLFTFERDGWDPATDTDSIAEICLECAHHDNRADDLVVRSRGRKVRCNKVVYAGIFDLCFQEIPESVGSVTLIIRLVGVPGLHVLQILSGALQRDRSH